MKRELFLKFAVVIIFSGIISSAVCYSQTQKAVIKKYLTELPSKRPADDGILQKYRMTAVYTNRDLYGNFTGKMKVTGEYTRGRKNGSVTWNNVFIASSNSYSEPFSEGTKQEYMENFEYVPSAEMLNEEAFKDFPANTENVFARNLIWDMMTIETFAWNYSDLLKLNLKYIVPDINGEFNMADIGTYDHANIQLCWTGISVMNNELCAVIEYRAIDNKIEIAMDQIQTRGTEQYWGTTWISLKSSQVEYAEMYGGTIQEIELNGFKDKFLIKTIGELRVERIK